MLSIKVEVQVSWNKTSTLSHEHKCQERWSNLKPNGVTSWVKSFANSTHLRYQIGTPCPTWFPSAHYVAEFKDASNTIANRGVWVKKIQKCIADNCTLYGFTSCMWLLNTMLDHAIARFYASKSYSTIRLFLLFWPAFLWNGCQRCTLDLVLWLASYL